MDLNSKITMGLGRLTEVFKVLLWEQAKRLKLSPIQIQILHFINTHTQDLCNVSYLAKEFNVTKPTISDAIRVLVKKELLVKTASETDNRRYSLKVSDSGLKAVQASEHFAQPVGAALGGLSAIESAQLFKSISHLIYQLNQSGVLTVQRMCYGCRFYEQKNAMSYCHLLEKPLLDSEIRLDCPEYEEA